MFDVFEETAKNEPESVAKVEEWIEQDRLRFEKEAIGFYITGHPLERFSKDLSWFTDATSASILEGNSPREVSIAGIPMKLLIKNTRKGDRMGIVTLEDLQGSLEVIIWPELFAECEQLFHEEEPVLIKGKVDADGNFPKVIADKVFPLAEAKNHWKGKVHIQLRTPGLERETLLAVKNILAGHKGSNETYLHFIFPDNHVRQVEVESQLRIQPSDEVIHDIEAVLGKDTISFE
jgi:DNA polymerase-3 subunit alpha